MNSNISKATIVGPWNKGRIVGQKLPLKLREIWTIRIRLQLSEQVRDLALFNLDIDSKLRGCDLVSLRVKDVSQGRSVVHRAIVMQRKTGRPVQFEVTEQPRQSVLAWIDRRQLSGSQYLFPSRVSDSPHLSTRQYARIVTRWVKLICLDAAAYGTHSMRRTKATLIYRLLRDLKGIVDLDPKRPKKQLKCSKISGGSVGSIHEKLRVETTSHDVQCMAVRDPEWTVYASFSK